MKFTMQIKDLKELLEKGGCIASSKLYWSALSRIYLTVSNGIIKASSTDVTHSIEVTSNKAWDTVDGCIAIDVDDLKIITKMTEDVTITDISEDTEGKKIKKVNIQCGKKVVTILGYDNEDLPIPCMKEDAVTAIILDESWLLETITNLAIFTGVSDSNKLLQTIYFNNSEKRVEAIDGQRIGIRTLEGQEVSDKSVSFMLHNMSVPVLKKVMSKKFNYKVRIIIDQEQIEVVGEDFIYFQKRVAGVYFDTTKMLKDTFDYSFNVNTKSMKEIMKYENDMISKERKGTILHVDNGKLYAYIRTGRYESLDEIKADNINMDPNLYIAFSAKYLLDIFSIIDSEDPLCKVINSKAPMYIEGNEYKFIILPVNVNEDAEKMNECICRNKVA